MLLGMKKTKTGFVGSRAMFFYLDWCISSGAKVLRFKYAFIIWCGVLLLLIIHNTRHASDVLHQSLHIYMGFCRFLCSLLSDIGHVMVHKIDRKRFVRISRTSFGNLKSKKNQFVFRLEIKTWSQQIEFSITFESFSAQIIITSIDFICLLKW